MIISNFESYTNTINDIKLYDYQLTILKNMINHEYNKYKIGYLHLPSGIGKTMLILALCKNNGLSLLVLPDNMITNCINRLTKYKIKFIEFSNDGYQSLDFSRTNLIITTAEHYDTIIGLNLDFSRIIFDDTELDVNYLSVTTDFTWVVSASIQGVNEDAVIRCSQDFINKIFKFNHVYEQIIICDNNFDIVEEDGYKKELLLNEDFESYLKIADEVNKVKVTTIIRLRNSLNIYSSRLQETVNILIGSKLTIVFVKHNHEYIKNILCAKYDIQSEILRMDDYDIINKFNDGKVSVLLVEPSFKGVGLINAKKIVIYDELNNNESENCVGRVLRQSRSKDLRLDIYKLFYK